MKTSYASLGIVIFSGVRGMADAALFRALRPTHYFAMNALWHGIAVEADHSVPRTLRAI